MNSGQRRKRIHRASQDHHPVHLNPGMRFQLVVTPQPDPDLGTALLTGQQPVQSQGLGQARASGKTGSGGLDRVYPEPYSVPIASASGRGLPGKKAHRDSDSGRADDRPGGADYHQRHGGAGPIPPHG